MHGYLTVKGEVVADIDPSGKPQDDGPLYLLVEGRRIRMLLLQAPQANRAPIQDLALQARAAFLRALGTTVEVRGYVSGRIIYEAVIVGPS